ncbi:MAG: Uma2 family endonuclease [Bacteroidota bacterium]
MSTLTLVNQLLDHHNPREVYAEVEKALEREKHSRAKFRQWLKPDVKAEFILGEVVVHSPALEGHNATVLRITTLLSTHCAFTNQGQVRVEKALVATQRNDFEPDVSVWLKERADNFKDDMKYYPAPDLVVEVLSDSTEKRDRGIKYEDYLGEGVSEYWIVDYRNEKVEQYLIGTAKYGGEKIYRKTILGKNDQLTSTVLPGFSVLTASLFYQEAFAEELRQFGKA